MFIKKKRNIIFRNYQSFGYITDNWEFRYKKTNDKRKNVGDRILSESGKIFFSLLKDNPKNINDLAQDVSKYYSDVDINILKKDLKEFYTILEHHGFVVIGQTELECNNKDYSFSYKPLEDNNQQDSFTSSSHLPLELTENYISRHFNGDPVLSSVHMEITSKCNERCIHCYIPHHDKISTLPSSLFYNILSQCNDMNILHLTISGGEPMLHRNFCDFLKKIREYGFSVNILSNLTLLNDEIITEMIRNPLLGVQVSLYSMDASIHDAITKKKGSFE